MAKAVADPEELRRFAADLKSFNETVRQHATTLGARFENLGATWRDQEHRKFAEHFEQTMRGLARFTNEADEHIPYLLRKAERLEEYLNQR